MRTDKAKTSIGEQIGVSIHTDALTYVRKVQRITDKLKYGGRGESKVT